MLLKLVPSNQTAVDYFPSSLKIGDLSYLPKWRHEDNIFPLHVILTVFKTSFMIGKRELRHFFKLFIDGPLIPINGESRP